MPRILSTLGSGFAFSPNTTFPRDTLMENVETGNGDDIVYGTSGANDISVHLNKSSMLAVEAMSFVEGQDLQ